MGSPPLLTISPGYPDTRVRDPGSNRPPEVHSMAVAGIRGEVAGGFA